MNFRKLLVGLGVVSLGSVSMTAAGQEQAQIMGDSISLNLDKVLEIALSDNPDIQVADRTVEIQKYAKKETISGLFPTIDVSATGSKSIILQKMKLDFAPEPISMGQPFVYQLSGQAVLPLVVPQLWKSISVSEEQVQLSLEQARESKVKTISAVKKAFYQLLLARDSYDVLQSSYRTSQENLDLTRQKFQQGSVAEYDTLTAFVQHESLRPNILSAGNGIKLAEMQLKVLMGVDVNEPFRFTGQLKDYEEDLFNDLMKLRSDTSLIENSTLRQLDSQERLLLLSEKINRLGYLPTLALSFSTGYQGMGKSFNPSKISYFPSATVALAFSWNVFDGFKKYLTTRQNQLKLQNLEEQRENVARQLELAVTSSLNGIETAAKQVVSNKSNVYSAEKAYTISCKRYDIGSGTQLEKNSSETNYLSTRLQYIQSIYDFLINRASLEETLGKVVLNEN